MPFHTLQPRNLALIFGTSITLLALARWTATANEPPQIIRSPRETILPKLSKQERDELPYPPDAMPGARDVDSAYGTMRCYEWGPQAGPKILLIHGISTPSLALRSLANHLVFSGCRVLLLDLFGRGYSDSPPLPHDPRLYTTQILLALTSSPIAWTPSGFSMIGYSLGGGICADFAADFPHLVKGLILLAPSGLIRSSHFGWSSRFMYSGWVPESVLEWVVRRRLGAHASTTAVKKSGDEHDPTTSEELKGSRDPKFDAVELRPGVTIGVYAQWQLNHHDGYLRSFVSSIRYSSIEGTGETWKRLARREGKILVVAGSEDAVIIAKELEEDAKGFLGRRLDFRVVEGGHEFPINKSDETAKLVIEYLDV